MEHEDLVFKTSRWQRLLYDLERQAQPGLDVIARRGEKKRKEFTSYQREVFARMYDPRVPRLDTPRDGAQWAAKLHSLAEEVPEFRTLQTRTMGDEVWSGVATAAVNKSVLAKMKKQKNGTNEDITTLKNRVEVLEKMGAAGLDVTDRIAKARRAVHKAQERAKDMAQGLDPSQVRNAVRAGCERAQQEIDRQEEQLSAFTYGDQPGTPASLRNKEDKRALAARLKGSSKLQDIARLAGKLRMEAAKRQRSKSNYAREEVTSVEQGADVPRLLPNEWALASDAATRALFYSRLAERKAVQYRLTGKEPQGRGPVVICLDESGSMQGEPEVWSKAVALALLDICQRQRRSWVLIHFSSAVTRVDVVKSGEVSQDGLLNAMAYFTGGGTSFQAPLDRAVKVIREEGGYRNADILLVTDGRCETSEGWDAQFKTTLQELEASVTTVIAGGGSTGTAARWSTAVYTLADILEGMQGQEFQDRMFSI